MLYYTPQIWCSDNTDAFKRMKIQWGTSYWYPPFSMGSHYSVVPNHITSQTIRSRTRALCAMMGSYGYELNLSPDPEDEAKLKGEHRVRVRELRVRPEDEAKLKGGHTMELSIPKPEDLL